MRGIILSLALTGCAPQQFVRLDVTERRAAIDLYQCQRENTATINAVQEAMVRACMRARGYIIQ